jgi:hypothetical protein
LLEADPIPVSVGLGLAWKIFFHRPAPLAKPACLEDCTTDQFPGFVSRALDRNTAERLRTVADAGGATLNDLLLRDMFLAMRDWNRAHGAGGRARLGIMMPTDMRTADDCEMPAANLTSYTFLRRNIDERSGPGELLSNLQAETALIKTHRLGTQFMSNVAWAARRAKLLPFLAARNICLATVVLSNAGDPSRRFTGKFTRHAGRIVAGNLVLEAITGVPPLRPKTRATFSISQYGRKLTVSVRCDPACFSMAQSENLLNTYVDRLLQSARLSV